MLVGWYVKSLGDLAFSIDDNLLDCCNDLVDQIFLASDLDGVSISIGLRELDSLGKLSLVVRTPRIDDNVPKSRT